MTQIDGWPVQLPDGVRTDKPVYPVIEIFGPVIEGEGFHAGMATSFVRFGYCDYRCGLDRDGKIIGEFVCDSLHAVLPKLVVQNAEWLTAEQIATTIITEHAEFYPLVTFSGGNPVLHELGPVVKLLKEAKRQVKVETQGTKFRPWLELVDHVVISPKPPSARQKHLPEVFRRFYGEINSRGIPHSLKIVIFDERDLDWAYDFSERYHLPEVYLSCGTKAEDTRDDLGERYARLMENSLQRFRYSSTVIRVLLQLHVIAHLHRLGV